MTFLLSALYRLYHGAWTSQPMRICTMPLLRRLITEPEDGFDRGLRRVYLGVERAIAARLLQAGSDGYPGAESLPGDHDDAVGRTPDRSEDPALARN